jgi:hypothetical protein
LQLARFEEPLSAGVVCVFTLGHTDLTPEDTKSCPLGLSRTTSPPVGYWYLADIRMPPAMPATCGALSQNQSQAPWMHRQLR